MGNSNIASVLPPSLMGNSNIAGIVRVLLPAAFEGDSSSMPILAGGWDDQDYYRARKPCTGNNRTTQMKSFG